MLRLRKEKKNRAKTYSSGYPLVAADLTTNPPVHCLDGVERMGSLVVFYTVNMIVLVFCKRHHAA